MSATWSLKAGDAIKVKTLSGWKSYTISKISKSGASGVTGSEYDAKHGIFTSFGIGWLKSNHGINWSKC